MKLIISILLLSFLSISFSQKNIQNKDKKSNLIVNDTIKTKDSLVAPTNSISKNRNIVTIGSVEFGTKIDSIPVWKVDAAMNLIASMSNKFSYFPMEEKLNLIDSLTKSNIANPTKVIIDSLKINWVFNFKINKLQNILGVNLTALSLKDSTKSYTDNGFAYLNLRDSTKKSVYDISLTNAIQRAICKTLKDSTIYKDAIEDYKVYPYPTIVVGGLEFIENSNMAKWALFTDKQVTSYDVAESIWEETYKEDRFVAFDIESRDSLYTLFNMYGVENYDKPTPFEIKALNAFEVKYFITGTFERASPGAIIKLHICKLEPSGLKIVSTGKTELTEDNLTELRKQVKLATKKAIENFRKLNG